MCVAANAALDWDILNDACTSTAGWTFSYGSATAVTFDGKSCLKFQTLSGSTTPNLMYHTPDVYPSSNFTYETSIYIDTSGTLTTVSPTFMSVRVNSGASPYDKYVVRITPSTATASGTIGIKTNSTDYHYARLGDIDDQWLDIRLVVTAGRKASVWVNNRCILSDIVCTGTSVAAKNVHFQVGTTASQTADVDVYLDYIRVDTSPEVQATESPLKIYDENLSVRPYQNADVDESASKFRIYGENTATGSDEVLEVPLVATTDANASKVRMYDGSAVKSLMKLPE